MWRIAFGNRFCLFSRSRGRIATLAAALKHQHMASTELGNKPVANLDAASAGAVTCYGQSGYW